VNGEEDVADHCGVPDSSENPIIVVSEETTMLPSVLEIPETHYTLFTPSN
jgi:hypothetical protein